jgi:hypothetical protein
LALTQLFLYQSCFSDSASKALKTATYLLLYIIRNWYELRTTAIIAECGQNNYRNEALKYVKANKKIYKPTIAGKKYKLGYQLYYNIMAFSKCYMHIEE